MPTLVCTPIPVVEVHAALRDAALAAEHGADLVEYRIDGYFSGSGDTEEEAGVLRLVRESPLPCIVTCRPIWEGGEYDGDDSARVSLFERLGAAEDPAERPRYLDVELAAYTRSANLRQKVNLAVDHPKQQRDVTTSLILSTHDFEERPSDLTRRLLAMADEDACRVMKIAYRARSLRDNLDLVDLLGQARELGKPAVALGMGAFGLMSRVLAPKFGAFLTFASLRDESATAPGQPTLDELLHRYRFRSIGRATKLYGVIGWPVEHSQGPVLHNRVFDELDWDGVYLHLPVPADGGAPEASDAAFKATLLAMIHDPRLDFAGASVTLPHKERLLHLARAEGWTVSAIAERSGAANTLAVHRDAQGKAVRIEIDNTDASAAAAVLAEAMPDGLSERRVAVLGAGGVARGIVAGCLAAGASVEVFARSADRAASLASAFDAGAVRPRAWEDRPGDSVAAVVNATPIGMAGGPDPAGSPLDASAVGTLAAGGAVVFDTVYTPRRTPMLAAAQSAGCRTADGWSMFLRQARAQSAVWTGRSATDAMLTRIFESVDVSRGDASDGRG